MNPAPVALKRHEACVGLRSEETYDSEHGFPVSNPRTKASRTELLHRLADQVLEAPDLEALTRLLTQALPAAVEVTGGTLLLWDRKLECVEALSIAEGETRLRAWRSEAGSVPTSTPTHPASPIPHPDQLKHVAAAMALVRAIRRLGHRAARLDPLGSAPPGDPALDKMEKGEGTLVPLIARSGLMGTLVLGRPRRRRRTPFSPSAARMVSVIAGRAALALENQLYQKELITTERMAALGTMAGMLAHDFRGPMTVIRGYAETLLETGLSTEEVRLRADLIVQSVDRLERMTTETLDFARGGGTLARRNVFLPTVGKRGAAIIEARGLSSAASAANAAIDHVRDWMHSSNGKWVTMGVPSDGSYGIPADVMYGVPVTTANGEYTRVAGLEIDAFSREKMDATLRELEEERAAVASMLS